MASYWIYRPFQTAFSAHIYPSLFSKDMKKKSIASQYSTKLLTILLHHWHKPWITNGMQKERQKERKEVQSQKNEFTAKKAWKPHSKSFTQRVKLRRKFHSYCALSMNLKTSSKTSKINGNENTWRFHFNLIHGTK